MTTRLSLLASSSLTALMLFGAAAGSGNAFAQRVKDSATPTGTVTASPSVTGTPAMLTGTPTAATQQTSTSTGTPSMTATHATPPTSTLAINKTTKLPYPVVLEDGLQRIGTGFDPKKAMLLANSYVPRLFIVAPRYVPKGYILQLIHVDPAQDQQTPADAYLQYVPKNLTNAKGAYPSFYVNLKNGLSTVIFPGVKPKVVTINPGKKGIGIVKGTVVDFKPKHGSEIVHVIWSRLTVSYDVTSNITKSRLTIKDLIAVAATIQ